MDGMQPAYACTHWHACICMHTDASRLIVSLFSVTRPFRSLFHCLLSCLFLLDAGVSKLTAHFTVLTYRAAYGIFCVSGILFNHESPRRGTTFVSRKITRGVARILKGELPYLELGNLDARRDWGHARDYVKAMWLMLQQETPKDFVVATDTGDIKVLNAKPLNLRGAQSFDPILQTLDCDSMPGNASPESAVFSFISTGEQHSVRDFCEMAFAMVGLPLKWRGKGLAEQGFCGDRVLVRVAAAYLRPTEVPALRGEASNIKRELGWRLETTFPCIVVYPLLDVIVFSGWYTRCLRATCVKLDSAPPLLLSVQSASLTSRRDEETARAHDPSGLGVSGHTPAAATVATAATAATTAAAGYVPPDTRTEALTLEAHPQPPPDQRMLHHPKHTLVGIHSRQQRQQQ
ncbi:hypothetical protein ACSSS7_008197 [Eimeria intestinalis]